MPIVYEDNIQKEDYSRTYHGFKQYEIEKLKRNISLIKSEYLGTKNVFRNFYMYFSEIDRRRKTDFIKTFPELKTIYEETRRIITGV